MTEFGDDSFCNECVKEVLEATGPYSKELADRQKMHHKIYLNGDFGKLGVEASDGSSASYYFLPAESKQLQDLISYRNMNAQIGEIFRACYRYGRVAHSDKLRDIKKIIYYANAELERLTKYKD